MMSRRSTRFLVRLVPFFALPLLLPSCDQTTPASSVCGATLNAEIDAMIAAGSALDMRTATLEMGVLTACEGIVVDLGGTAPARTGTLDNQVQTACNAAVTAINAAKVGATVTIAYAPPRCHINAEAQLSCEATCTANASCTPGTVDVRCMPGDLSVVCSGMCQASAICEATAQAPIVNCDGTCEGECVSGCSVATDAAGRCTGTCNGQCRGNCTIRPGSAGVSCGAMARCRGGCSATGTLPQCEGDLTPPTCSVDANCQAGCQGQASFEATCDPASLNIVVTGGSNATALTNTLKTNLPILLEVRDNLAAAVADVNALVTAGQAVAVSLQAVPACAAIRASELTASAQAAAAAAASVTVSVSVSVSVSTSASL